MIKKTVKGGLALLVLGTAAAFWLVYTGEPRNGSAHVSADHAAHVPAPPQEKPEEKNKKIKYWVAPMDPTYIRNEPGKSPMGMDLVPVYEDEDEKSSEGVIKIDPVTVQNIGVRTAPATRGDLNKNIRTVGRITYDERGVEHIHTKVSGWVEKLSVDTTGQEVRKGQELLSIYSPELVATQEEYLQALKYRDRTASSKFPEIAEGGGALVDVARKRLLFMDINEVQIEDLEKSREVRKNLKLFAPRTGIVIKKNVLEGMKVDSMMELYTIADLSRVWVIASVYEYEIPFLTTGQEAEMTLSYEPGASYRGKVTFVYPFISSQTRTVDVRMEFDNPGLKLKPDMYADVVIKVKTGAPSIMVPSEAVIRTGSRSVVITSLGKGKFLPKEVTVGSSGEGFMQILGGLEEGELVVTSGQFLIDSESNLREAVNKMLAAQAAETSAGQSGVAGGGKSEKGEFAVIPGMSDEQKKLMSGLMENYLNIQSALAAQSAPEAAKEARAMSAGLQKLKASDSKGQIEAVTGPMEDSLKGIASGDLQKAKTSFKTLSRTMIGYAKGPGKDHALSSGLKLYFCPMEEEHWMQKAGDLRNPYLGQDMLICGIEEPL
ncbi:MAG: efflux RND transporter periplasmic adaptor subunit [Nitrospiraceae bacterium]|nr:MAG: efflux RND transporter periplasmic adaptor subunit [Nitrospiraceae bacterium]